jgi:DNA-binding NtrC family response regulator
MLCLVARFANQRVRFPLPEREAIIGSAASSDIMLPFPGVSRAHARIIRNGDRIHLLDLGSKNRLVVGVERRDEVELVEGSTIQVGRAFLTLEDASSSDVVLALRASGAAARDESTAVTAQNESSSDRGLAAALRYVRSVEGARARLRSRRHELLEDGRALLGASSIALLAIDRQGEVAVEVLAGDMPPAAALEELKFLAAARRQKSMPVLRSISGERVLYWIERRKSVSAALVVSWPDEHGATEPWKVDLAGYMALKLLESLDSANEGDAPVAVTLQSPPEMIAGSSAAMRSLLTQMERTVSSRMDVLLWGETGTGKELFARMIHMSGPTSAGPFVAINCAAIPTELLEAELFGVEGRVATGVDPRRGHFVLADGGSVFLDEVGELPDRLQAKLLRVLQEREVLSVGASRTRKISLRVIAASNRDLFALTKEGKFRSDLYYRLRGLQFHIPPLRDRREDIPGMVLAFVDRTCSEYKRRVTGVSRKALALLVEYDWPGNVRELKSEVERAVLVTPNGSAIQAEAFSSVRWGLEHHRAAPEREEEPPAVAESPANPALLKDRVDQTEREEILRVLREAGGNRSLAARLLGISRNGLALKLRRLGLKV